MPEPDTAAKPISAPVRLIQRLRYEAGLLGSLLRMACSAQAGGPWREVTSDRSSESYSQQEQGLRQIGVASPPAAAITGKVMDYVLTGVEGHQQRKALARRLARPRQRPLDRRMDHPLPFEDERLGGSATFREHEHGLTVVARSYGGPTATIELDERNARLLCFYLAFKIEGGPAYDLDWHRAVSFSATAETGCLKLEEHRNGLLIIAEPQAGPNVIIQLDNWDARRLCRDLHYRVEGVPLSGPGTS